MQEVLSAPANPSSVHSFGRAAKKILEDARATLAQAISVFPNEIIFTASATEANAMALRGVADRRVLVSATEHSSVLKHGKATIPVHGNGRIDFEELEKILADSAPALVSVMLANNETGLIQPIHEVAALCKRYDALLHCDAVQGLGKIPVDFGKLGVDMMTVSSHKCGGPVGAAALVVRRKLAVEPLLIGGGQELNRRAGTENVAAIAGFAKAVELVDLKQMENLRGRLQNMESGMKMHKGEIVSESFTRLANTTCVIMPGVTGEVQLMNFDLAGFAVSAGSACSSGRIEPSHVLLAMHMPKEKASCAIRISGGWGTTEKDISGFLECWKETCARLAK